MGSDVAVHTFFEGDGAGFCGCLFGTCGIPFSDRVDPVSDQLARLARLVASLNKRDLRGHPRHMLRALPSIM
jgi:hypothetical protein